MNGLLDRLIVAMRLKFRVLEFDEQQSYEDFEVGKHCALGLEGTVRYMRKGDEVFWLSCTAEMIVMWFSNWLCSVVV